MTSEEIAAVAKAYQQGLITIAAISAETGIPRSTIATRISRGWTMLDCLRRGRGVSGGKTHGQNRYSKIYWFGLIGGSPYGWAKVLGISVDAFIQRVRRSRDDSDPRIFEPGEKRRGPQVVKHEKKYRYVSSDCSGNEEYRSLSCRSRDYNLEKIKPFTDYDRKLLGGSQRQPNRRDTW